MIENPFKNKKSKQEELVVNIDIPTEKDWQTYKDLKLEAIANPEDVEMLGINEDRLKALRAKKEDDWKKDLMPSDLKFVLLTWNGSEAIGTTSAKSEKEEGVWYIYDVYIKPEFRNKGLGQIQLATCLDEILLRNGRKATMFVKEINDIQLHIVLEKFGFKKVTHEPWEEIYYLESDLTNVDTIKKISDVLDAG